ncbi:MAG TPA: allantoinase AllB [Acidobacteriota bacterium]|nr:allantoinase AllB [Acidobacteriota bacterium]
MQLDSVFSSSRVALPGGVQAADVGMRNGLIAAVADAGSLTAAQVHDLDDLYLLPGLVDPHVHVNEPGRAHWEGFETASMAAAAGGVTTLVDMPLNSSPVTTTVRALRAKVESAAGKCSVDYGFWGGLVPGNHDHLGDLLDAGARGLKCFLCPSGLDDFPALPEADLAPATDSLVQRGKPLLVHAEGPGVLEHAAAVCGLADSPRSYGRYLASRPEEAERTSIERLIALSDQTRCHTHVVHLSAASCLPLLAAARRDGTPITVETCPHYLTLAAEDVVDGATQFKCAPPIRSKANSAALWRALDEGTIDLIASDHSPCPTELRCLDSGDFCSAWGGIAGLQLGLALVWTEAHERGYGIDRVRAWMCTEPARLAGIERRKGSIAEGLDADLVVFDPDATSRVDPAALLHRHPDTPYAGTELRGRVIATFLRGRCVYDNGKIDGAHGQWIDAPR